MTPEDAARKYRDRHLWSISQRNVIWAGQMSAEDSARDVNDFLELIPLFDLRRIVPNYQKRISKWTEPTRATRVRILRNMMEQIVNDHILGDDETDAFKIDKAKRARTNLAVLFGNLERESLHGNRQEKDPFVHDHTKGEKIRVEKDGQEIMVEVKSACPAIEIATQLYWSFERIIEGEPSQEPTQR